MHNIQPKITRYTKKQACTALPTHTHPQTQTKNKNNEKQVIETDLELAVIEFKIATINMFKNT